MVAQEEDSEGGMVTEREGEASQAPPSHLSVRSSVGTSPCGLSLEALTETENVIACLHTPIRSATASNG